MEAAELNELVKLYGKSVYGFCHKLAKNKTDTDDLYQETFLKAVELCQKIDRGSNPKGFLISIAIGLWKNHRRKYARRQRIAPMEEFSEDIGFSCIHNSPQTPEDITVSKELRTSVLKAADKLNDKLRIPLFMYYTAEMSTEDIASALNIPLGTVKSRLHKAREVMKKTLEVNGNE